MAERLKGKKWFVVPGIITAVLLLILCLVIGIFHVDHIQIEGNEYYTEEEIKDFILVSKYDYNSLYLYWKYNYSDAEHIPFIAALEVSMLSPDKVKIKVYEKSMVGYIEHLGHYLYFDKDGVVVESSSREIEGVPRVSGLQFGHVVLRQKLPIEEEEIFKTLLNITQLLKKYDLKPERIYFSTDLEITLFFGDVKAALGSVQDIEDKVEVLPDLLVEIEEKDLKATIHMENYTNDMKNISMTVDGSKVEKPKEEPETEEENEGEKTEGEDSEKTEGTDTAGEGTDTAGEGTG